MIDNLSGKLARVEKDGIVLMLGDIPNRLDGVTR